MQIRGVAQLELPPATATTPGSRGACTDIHHAPKIGSNGNGHIGVGRACRSAEAPASLSITLPSLPPRVTRFGSMGASELGTPSGKPSARLEHTSGQALYQDGVAGLSNGSARPSEEERRRHDVRFVSPPRRRPPAYHRPHHAYRPRLVARPPLRQKDSRRWSPSTQ